MGISDSVSRTFTCIDKLNHFWVQALVIILGEHTLDFKRG